MITRTSVAAIALAAALALAACGGDDASAVAADISAPTTSAPAVETATEETATEETVAETTTSAAPEPAAAENCADFITVDDVNSVLGVPVEISGSATVCNFIYADDAVGSFQAFTGSRASQALELLEEFKVDSSKWGGGEVLDGDRGFISASRLVLVVGESGTVFSMSTPDNIGVDDVDGKLQGFADILLTK